MSKLRRVESVRKINDYSVLIPCGKEDGFEKGDRVIVTLRGDDVPARIVDAGRQESVVELLEFAEK